MQSAEVEPTASTETAEGGDTASPPAHNEVVAAPLVGIVTSGSERRRTDTTGAPCEEYHPEVLRFVGDSLFGPLYAALYAHRVEQGCTEGYLPRREAQIEARHLIAEDVRAALRIAAVYLTLPPLLRHRLVDIAEDLRRPATQSVGQETPATD